MSSKIDILNSAFTLPAVVIGELADWIGLHIVIVWLGVAVIASGIIDTFINWRQNRQT